MTEMLEEQTFSLNEKMMVLKSKHDSLKNLQDKVKEE